jgi:hypothetical protein
MNAHSQGTGAVQDVRGCEGAAFGEGGGGEADFRKGVKPEVGPPRCWLRLDAPEEFVMPGSCRARCEWSIRARSIA